MRLPLLVAFGAAGAGAHQMCLDYEPPFVPSTAPSGCPQYAELSCCSADADADIDAAVAAAVADFPAADADGTCEAYVRDWLCAPCSPWALHLYDGEESVGETMRSEPSLCAAEAEALYASCGAQVRADPDSGEGDRVADAYASAAAFAAAMAGPDAAYCLPTIDEENEVPSVVFGDDEECTTLCLEAVATEVEGQVVNIASTGVPGDERLFLNDQSGVVRILYPNGTAPGTPFLDISDVVVDGGEKGLLGLAFALDYASSGRFWVYYSTTAAGEAHHDSVVAECAVSADDANVANATALREVLRVEQPYSNHNGGSLSVHPEDGTLFVALGDGGSGGDPLGSGQDTTTKLGAVLRLDVSDPGGYAVPADNPFVGEDGFDDDIFAYGLRNPWRCAFDPCNSTRYLCGDVGQGTYEEVDLVLGGRNYGWNTLEALDCYNLADDDCAKYGTTSPLMVYDHTVGHSVTGGVVYRGNQFPLLHGAYVFADYYGALFLLYPCQQDGVSWNVERVCLGLEEECGADSQWERAKFAAFGAGNDGEIYLSSFDGGGTSTVFHVVDPRLQADPSIAAEQVCTPPAGAEEYECAELGVTPFLTGWVATIDDPLAGDESGSYAVLAVLALLVFALLGVAVLRRSARRSPAPPSPPRAVQLGKIQLAPPPRAAS